MVKRPIASSTNSLPDASPRVVILPWQRRNTRVPEPARTKLSAEMCSILSFLGSTIWKPRWAVYIPLKFRARFGYTSWPALHK